jgi:hypothetical protein
MLENSHFSNDEYKLIETPEMDFLDHKNSLATPLDVNIFHKGKNISYGPRD